MRKKKIKRKVTVALLVLFVVAVGLTIGSSKFIRVSVNSETIDTDSIPANFNDQTSSLEKIPLTTIKNDQSKNVILFSSSWCGTCGKLIQDLNRLAREYPEIKIYIMDLESDRENANSLNVPITPTLVLLDKGQTKNFPEVKIDNLSSIVSDFDRIGIR